MLIFAFVDIMQPALIPKSIIWWNLLVTDGSQMPLRCQISLRSEGLRLEDYANFPILEHWIQNSRAAGCNTIETLLGIPAMHSQLNKVSCEFVH